MDTPRRLAVTIARQVGAGGSYVGQALARRLGIRYVDRDILQKAAEVLGQAEGDLEPLEERVTTLWDHIGSILSLGAPEAPFVPPPVPVIAEDELFVVESNIMREMAAREDAVFVGRGGAWVLRDHPGLLRVFLHGPEAERLERIQCTYGMAAAAARQLMRQSDQQRGRFYETLSGAPWMAPASYDLCLNTGTLGLDPVVDLLAALIERRRQPALP